VNFTLIIRHFYDIIFFGWVENMQEKPQKTGEDGLPSRNFLYFLKIINNRTLDSGAVYG